MSDNDTEKSVALIEEVRTGRGRFTRRASGVGKQRERTRHVDPARNNTVAAQAVEVKKMRKKKPREQAALSLGSVSRMRNARELALALAAYSCRGVTGIKSAVSYRPRRARLLCRITTNRFDATSPGRPAARPAAFFSQSDIDGETSYECVECRKMLRACKFALITDARNAKCRITIGFSPRVNGSSHTLDAIQYRTNSALISFFLNRYEVIKEFHRWKLNFY